MDPLDFAWLLDNLPETCCGAAVLFAFLFAYRAGWIVLPTARKRTGGK